MPEQENNFIRTWIYSYLKYGGIATEAQRNRSKKRFMEYLEQNKESWDAVEEVEKSLANEA